MSLTKTIALFTLLALLVYTNPTMEDYGEYLRQEVVKDVAKENGLNKVIGSFFGGITSHLITNMTIRSDFVLFSLYKTDLGNNNTQVIGILNNFIVLDPDKFRNNLKDSLALE